jgi:HTH-type transcriptional regulator / antitoxin HipB
MRIKTPTDLGLVIRARRRKLGLDQRTLAERVGVSRQWIVDAEKGKPRAPVGLLLRTLDALGMRIRVDDDAPAAPPSARPVVDIDALVDKARGVKR